MIEGENQVISLKSVCKEFQGQRVLDQTSFELNRGEFLYLLGGTGAGKSTLLRLLATEEQPSSGSISLFGYTLDTASKATLQAIRQSIGYVPQEVRLISDFTVLENVALSITTGGRRALPAQAHVRINEILEKLGLGTKRDRLARTLSGGEAQRVAVARALARNPELIIADEPTGAQDKESTWSLMDLFLKANISGVTVILATHDSEIVRRVRKRCALLKNGRMTLEELACIY